VREIELKSNCTFSESNHAWERKSDYGSISVREEERFGRATEIDERARTEIDERAIWESGEIDLGSSMTS
jgi:hypothetical protein